MRFFHLSDLHLGKLVHHFSMIEDQRYALEQVKKYVQQYEPDVVFIAGDVYDKPIPQLEAIGLLDDFLTFLADAEIEVYIISGNHDSGGRLQFGRDLFARNRIHIIGEYADTIPRFLWKNKEGESVVIYMLPYVRASAVKGIIEENKQRITEDKVPKVLLAHQFITGAKLSDSEDIIVGGMDNIDGHLFDDFTYVALGHLHGPQKVVREEMRYCGTLLPYSFSECNQKKEVLMGEITQSGKVELTGLPIVPLHPMKEIKGTLQELLALEQEWSLEDREAYIHAVLMDEKPVADAVLHLMGVFPNLMLAEFGNLNQEKGQSIEIAKEILRKSPVELFCDFYKQEAGTEMNEEELECIKDIFESIR